MFIILVMELEHVHINFCRDLFADVIIFFPIYI